MENINQKTGLWAGLPTWAKGVIAVSVTAGVVYVGYKIYKKVSEKREEHKDDEKDKGQITAQLKDSFANIPTYIGKGVKLTSKGDAYITSLPSANKTLYYFVYWSNGRVFVYRNNVNDNKNIVSRGKYFDSGKIITLDNGKSFQNNSVWANMENIIKEM